MEVNVGKGVHDTSAISDKVVCGDRDDAVWVESDEVVL